MSCLCSLLDFYVPFLSHYFANSWLVSSSEFLQRTYCYYCFPGFNLIIACLYFVLISLRCSGLQFFKWILIFGGPLTLHISGVSLTYTPLIFFFYSRASSALSEAYRPKVLQFPGSTIYTIPNASFLCPLSFSICLLSSLSPCFLSADKSILPVYFSLSHSVSFALPRFFLWITRQPVYLYITDM